jgi:hypothetical protein
MYLGTVLTGDFVGDFDGESVGLVVGLEVGLPDGDNVGCVFREDRLD